MRGLFTFLAGALLLLPLAGTTGSTVAKENTVHSCRGNSSIDGTTALLWEDSESVESCRRISFYQGYAAKPHFIRLSLRLRKWYILTPPEPEFHYFGLHDRYLPLRI